MNNNEQAFCDGICEKDMLHYGEIIVDEVYNTWDGYLYRLRAIRYEGKLYWHKMVDGKVIEFRGLR